MLRASDLLVPDFASCPRTGDLSTCGVPSAIEASDSIARLGGRIVPFHVMVPDGTHSHCTNDIARHTCRRPLPSRSLVRIKRDVLCAGPELCFLQMAPPRRYATWQDEAELALIGLELCGTYRLDPDSEKGFRNVEEPLTSTDRLRRFLDSCGSHPGGPIARRAIESVADGSNSPMESVMALRLLGKRRIGGLGIDGGVLNYRIRTQRCDRYVDLAFPRAGVGLEYQGKAWHLDAEADDRRRNNIIGSGMTLITVRFKDMADLQLFDDLVHDLSRAMGIRIRPRGKDFRLRQRQLGASTLPGPRYSA